MITKFKLFEHNNIDIVSLSKVSDIRHILKMLMIILLKI